MAIVRDGVGASVRKVQIHKKYSLKPITQWYFIRQNHPKTQNWIRKRHHHPIRTKTSSIQYIERKAVTIT